MSRRYARIGAGALALFAVAPVTALAAPSGQAGFLTPDPAGTIDLPAGYTYTTLAVSCVTPARSTESEITYPMPDDLDGNVLFQGQRDEMWLLSNHQLTQPR